MQVTVNGETKELEATTVAELIVALQLPGGRVAVERNGTIVRRADHGTTAVVDGDRFEIVTLVGGG